jgi:hypothetical protein
MAGFCALNPDFWPGKCSFKRMKLPKTNRYFLPGYVWNIPHQCYKRDFRLDKAGMKLSDGQGLRPNFAVK